MPIDFICTTCEIKMERKLQAIVPHTEVHIVEAIKKGHPGWVEEGGICKKCYDYYKKQMRPE